MSETKTNSKEKAEKIRRVAVEMRSRLNGINDEGLDPDVGAALADAYFTLGDLKHACIDHLASEDDGGLG